MADPKATVQRVIDGWNNKDIDAIMAEFAEDAVFDNIPMEPIVGQAAIRESNAQFLAIVEKAQWEILSIAVSEDGKVLTERRDRFRLRNGIEAAIAVMGIFELDSDGRIKHWRDYFDLTDWNRQIGMDTDMGRRAEPAK